MDTKWDRRFLELAKHISTWSKDPSTKVGCVIVNDAKKVVALGFNGFPKNIEDSYERLINREIKYKMIIHAEINALLNSNSSVEGCTLFSFPLSPCENCMKLLIQAGIKRIVSPVLLDEMKARWGESIKFAESMAKEAGIVMTTIEEIPS